MLKKDIHCKARIHLNKLNNEVQSVLGEHHHGINPNSIIKLKNKIRNEAVNTLEVRF